ncbi:MAG TPA: glycoside hydrolase family 30 protein [Candidatus Didemnitutus sp.]|nr:glycoside hydrolase family 30 protein [Candidatus Didemnitutus sp.]
MKRSRSLATGLLALGSAALVAAAPRTWTVVETARDNSHRLATVAAPAPAATNATAAKLVCDPAQRFQEMIGFGGALTESSAWALAQVSPEKRAEVLHRYFDPKDGLGYTLARTHINSCDFSLNMWELDATVGDYDLHDFSLAPMRKWLMPLLHDAIKASGGNLRILASPWSPPSWMKSNNRMDDGGSLRAVYAPAWANYFVKFVEAMKREENISIWALTVQNEPQAKQTWESCLYSPEEERNFVRDHLGPALEKAGLSQVKLFSLDHNRDLMEGFATAELGDPATAKYLTGIAIHWYVSDDFAASSRVHDKFPGKPIIFTEGCCEGGKSIGSWEHGEHYAHQMIGDFQNWVCNFMDWNIVLDERGGPNHVGNFCDAPVIIDTKTKEVRYGPSFYYLGHFSRYVKPGAHRIATTGGPAGLESVAFVNPDNSLAVVVLNRTDAALPLTLVVGGDALACSVPAHAIQTYLGAAQ